MRLLLLAITAAFWAVAANAALPKPADTRFILNNNPHGNVVQLGTQLVDKKVHVMRGQWSYAVVGGLSDTLQLKDHDGKNVVLPSNAVIVDCMVDVITQPSGVPSTTRAQINLGSTQAALVAQRQINGVTGRLSCVPNGTLSNALKTTGETSMSITILGGQLIAGKLNVVLQYVLSE